MQRLKIPGAVYGECLPSGEYAALVPGHGFVTHQGSIPIPEAEKQAGGLGPWQHRITNVGGFQIAGQSHGLVGVTWWYHGGQWARLPQTAVGVNAVIFDRQGALRISDGSVGSQGYRYVREDNTIISGDATYADTRRALGEYTELGGIAIGQSAYDCHAVFAHSRHVIATGTPPSGCTFIRVNYDGQTYAIALTQRNQVLLLWLTRAELLALPSPSQPAPEPEPDPVPEKLLARNIKHLVVRAMNEHHEIDTNSERARGAILDHAIGWAEAEGDLRWYRKGKKDGRIENTDALVFLRPDNRIEIYDVIVNGKAAWLKPTKTLAIGENGYPVKPKGSAPNPGTTDPTLGMVLAELRALREDLRGPATIAIKSAHGYLSVQPDGRIEWNREKPGPWEALRVENIE